MKRLNKNPIPETAKFKARRATSGEKSIIPSGGMIRLKGSKNGSTILPSIIPKLDSRALGNQDINMYMIHKNE